LRREHGFPIVARNWRSPHDRRDEIDLVCRDGEVLVFVEVKARTAGGAGAGILCGGRGGKNGCCGGSAPPTCAAAAEKPRTFRLDVVEVEMPTAAAGGAPVILHFRKCPLFPKHFHPGP
jgi:putative endonuclease